jgi:flagellin-like hook-associated protein FlgL
VLFDSHHAGDATHYGLLDGGRLPADGSLAADGVGDGTPPFSVAGTANGIDVSGLTGSGSDQAVLEAYIRAADAALQELASAAAVLDSVRAQIGMQDSFLTTLGEVIDGGFGQIVDTGMNEETARARALHVQAQIGIQPLPIANVSPQGILALSA